MEEEAQLGNVMWEKLYWSLLALKMGGSMNQGLWAASLEAEKVRKQIPERSTALMTPWFNLERSSLDFWPEELLNNKSMLLWVIKFVVIATATIDI